MYTSVQVTSKHVTPAFISSPWDWIGLFESLHPRKVALSGFGVPPSSSDGRWGVVHGASQLLTWIEIPLRIGKLLRTLLNNSPLKHLTCSGTGPERQGATALWVAITYLCKNGHCIALSSVPLHVYSISTYGLGGTHATAGGRQDQCCCPPVPDSEPSSRNMCSISGQIGAGHRYLPGPVPSSFSNHKHMLPKKINYLPYSYHKSRLTGQPHARAKNLHLNKILGELIYTQLWESLFQAGAAQRKSVSPICILK